MQQINKSEVDPLFMMQISKNINAFVYHNNIVYIMTISTQYYN